MAKYLLDTATNSNLLFLTLKRHAAAAILLASVVKTRSSEGSGTVSLKFKVASCLASFQDFSSIGPHEKDFFLRRKW